MEIVIGDKYLPKRSKMTKSLVFFGLKKIQNFKCMQKSSGLSFLDTFELSLCGYYLSSSLTFDLARKNNEGYESI